MVLGYGADDLHLKNAEYPSLNLSSLNDLTSPEKAEDSIKRFEKIHFSSLTAINNSFDDLSGINVILVSGPSSSGKTTLSKSLVGSFIKKGITAVEISLDDYYFGNDRYPLDELGNKDWESPLAIDFELFNENLHDLAAGKDILMPVFDFNTGERLPNGRKIKAVGDMTLIVEGLHALSDYIVLDENEVDLVKIFVNVMGSIRSDSQDILVEPPEFRKIRRLVRDYFYRSSGGADTLKKWDSVRRGEEKYVLPGTVKADIIFNTWLPYELTVLKKAACKILSCVKNGSEGAEAVRLLSLFDRIREVDPRKVPLGSLLNEFID